MIGDIMKEKDIFRDTMLRLVVNLKFRGLEFERLYSVGIKYHSQLEDHIRTLSNLNWQYTYFLESVESTDRGSPNIYCETENIMMYSWFTEFESNLNHI